MATVVQVYATFSPRKTTVPPFLLLRGILVLLQYPLPHQILRLRAIGNLLLQTIGAHVFQQFTLLALDCGRGGRVGKDVAWWYGSG